VYGGIGPVRIQKVDARTCAGKLGTVGSMDGCEEEGSCNRTESLPY
jgi:hypothetical protein